MPVHTRTSNATTRPGLVDRPSQKRSRQQIDEDDACAESAVKSSRKAAKIAHHKSIKAVAMAEDTVEKQEEDIQMYSARPDLQPDPSTLAEPAESESGSEKG